MAAICACAADRLQLPKRTRRGMVTHAHRGFVVRLSLAPLEPPGRGGFALLARHRSRRIRSAEEGGPVSAGGAGRHAFSWRIDPHGGRRPGGAGPRRRVYRRLPPDAASPAGACGRARRHPGDRGFRPGAFQDREEDDTAFRGPDPPYGRARERNRIRRHRAGERGFRCRDRGTGGGGDEQRPGAALGGSRNGGIGPGGSPRGTHHRCRRRR